MNRYDISALIVTYQPDYEKLKKTIISFLLQKNISIQIIIADDGSENDFFPMIKELFEDKGFKNYKLVKNKENIGTVKNIQSGLEVCEGKYIKTLSPGDYLIGENVLNYWKKYMENHQLGFSGSDYICYKNDENGAKSIVQKRWPRLNVREDELKKDYLLNEDIFLGAAMICETNLMKKYIEMLAGKVKFAEDNIYRLMFYNDERGGFYNSITVLYEIGCGISTSGNEKWIKDLEKDLIETDKVLMNLSTDNNEFKKDLQSIIQLNELKRNESVTTIKKLFCFIKIKKLLFLKIRKEICPRYTTDKLPDEWMKLLGEY